MSVSRAVLFGLALGDALGAPVEFMTLPAIRAQYGARGICEPPEPALYTDDTQLAFAVAEGLLDAEHDASLDVAMAAIGSRFVEWLHSPDNNRYPGATCLSGVTRYEQGETWRLSGIPESKGAGSAMRVAAIGLLYQHEPDRLRQLAEASTVITHRHPAAIAASVGAAYLVKLALDGVQPTAFMAAVLAFTDGISDEFDAAVYHVGHVLGWTDEVGALRHIGLGWTGEEAVALALCCVLRHPDDYAAAVRLAVNHDGDSDTVACIVGGIMGARLGLDAIPANWRDRCENRDYIENLAARLDATLLLSA